MSEEPTPNQDRQMSTDPDTIRRWAGDHDVVPVRDTESGEPRYRMVPADTVRTDQERLEWDAFFEEFREGDQVVVYHGGSAEEPFEVTDRETAVAHSGMDEAEFEERLIEGETVVSEVRETTVVESVVVEETTVESELVDRDVLDRRIIDAELIDRGCTECRLVSDTAADDRELFDADRYLGSVAAMVGSGRTDRTGTGEPTTGADTGETTTGTDAEGSHPDAAAEGRRGDADAEAPGTGTGEAEAERAAVEDTVGGISTEPDTAGEGAIEVGDGFPYYAELDVEETWTVVHETVERFTIESTVSDTEVTEADTIEDHDIDTEGLHRSIVESGVVDVEESPDEVLATYDIETEYDADDRILTHFDREYLTEAEVVDRKRLRANVTGGEYLNMETVSTRELASRDQATGGSHIEEPAEGEPTTEASGDVRTGQVAIDDDDVGKTVVDATGKEVGTVSGVDQGHTTIYVDPHQSITDRIKAALGWEHVEDEEYPLRTDHVQRITDDTVELKGEEEFPPEQT